ncbi:sensor histidine kinase [Bacillus sp. FJAT-27264]|uniref:sensor histidine kinase n=1 Tax=Paenibacillus sp. (strain DSM 101736 / FJAT-27264) TaxID=1850362 RepID=UPI001585EF90|nr:sensor histidine kinase [Bacillus sp. FJAT-27264]
MIVALGYLLSCCVPFRLYMLKRVPPSITVAAELTITGGLYFLLPKADQSLITFFQMPFLTLGYLCIGRYTSWITLAVFFLSALGLGQLSNMPWQVVLEDSVNLLLFFGIGFCFQKLVASYRIIKEQNATLQLYSQQIEQLTLTEERNRLSRDLHDTVGHTFTTTIIGMDATLYLIDVAPDQAKTNLRELLHLTRMGLDEVRQHIHDIAPSKEDELPLSHVLEQMCTEFSRHTGMKISLHVEGQEMGASESIRLLFIRCLQESLTNAKRHGEASQAAIELVYEVDSFTLTITDNGTGSAPIVKGFGLTGMTQRAANLGGNLEIVSVPGKGTSVMCTIPIRLPVSTPIK